MMHPEKGSCLLVIAALAVMGISSCKSNRVTDDTPTAEVDSVLETSKIKGALIEAFWRASDKTLRDNTTLKGQTSTFEVFKGEHVCDVFSDEMIDGKRIVKFHITIPSVKGAFYEFSFEEVDGKWRSIDGRTRVGNQEFNYYEGKFLGKKSLKPYLDAELSALGVPLVK